MSHQDDERRRSKRQFTQTLGTALRSCPREFPTTKNQIAMIPLSVSALTNARKPGFPASIPSLHLPGRPNCATALSARWSLQHPRTNHANDVPPVAAVFRVCVEHHTSLVHGEARYAHALHNLILLIRPQLNQSGNSRFCSLHRRKKKSR